VKDNEVEATKVSFGGYVLPKSMVSSIPASTSVSLSASLGNGIDTFVSDNVIYYGENPNTPAVGDVRVTFMQADGGEASIIGKVNGNTFEPFKHKNGKQMMTLQMGNHSMESMFESAKQANKFLLWVLRILGIILVIAALRMMFSILVTILKVLPPLAKVGELGVNLVTGVVGAVWALIIILIAWVAHRPVLAIVLALVIAALIYFLIKKSKAVADAAPAAPAAPATPAAPAAPAAPEAPKTDAE
jgi:ABC-type Fe3+-siderophore transport system permease subunit